MESINQVITKRSKAINITSINNEGETILDSPGISDSIDRFFCNVGGNLGKDILTRLYPFQDGAYEMPSQDGPFHFSPISCHNGEYYKFLWI